MQLLRGSLLPGFLCVLALTAVGCGGENGTDPTPETTTTEYTTTAAATVTETAVQTTSVTTAEVTTTVTETETTTSTESETATTAVSTVMQTWWTPPSTTATVITTVSARVQTVTEPEAWQTTASTAATAPEGYTLSESDEKFLKNVVFSGDSICSGLRVYKILPASNVVAKGSVGVRNIFDNTFKVGKYECDVITALKSQSPSAVVFSMGMNDIRVTSAEQFCENYKKLLTETQKALPSAKLYVASITPVLNGTEFTTNDRIDKYNKAIKDYLEDYPSWNYIDLSPELKNGWNGLKPEFNGGDGIHLAPAAYQAILWQVCNQIAQ